MVTHLYIATFMTIEICHNTISIFLGLSLRSTKYHNAWKLFLPLYEWISPRTKLASFVNRTREYCLQDSCFTTKTKEAAWCRLRSRFSPMAMVHPTSGLITLNHMQLACISSGLESEALLHTLMVPVTMEIASIFSDWQSDVLTKYTMRPVMA